MTGDFARTVINLAIEGLAFTAIEHFVINRRMEYIASIRLQIMSIFQALHGSTQPLDSSLDNVIAYIQKPYPSNSTNAFYMIFLNTRRTISMKCHLKQLPDI